jgi:hypothetical protein
MKTARNFSTPYVDHFIANTQQFKKVYAIISLVLEMRKLRLSV